MELNEEKTAPAIEQETAIEMEAVEPDADEVDETVNLEQPEGDGKAEPDIEPEDDADPDDDAEPEGEDQEPEMVSVEVNGKAYEVPKELERHIMLDRDYTQKSQVNAELKKSYEAKLNEATELVNVSQEEMDAKVYLAGVQQKLQQYQNVDWNQLERDDPIEAQSHWRQFQQLQQEAGQVNQYLQQKGQERTEKTEQMTAARLQETLKHAQTNIQGWTPELDAKITEFASQKFPREQLVQAMTPEIYEMMHLAYLGSQSLQKQQSAKPKQKVKAKPLSKVNAKAAPPTGRVEDIDDMEVYAAKRRKDLMALR